MAEKQEEHIQTAIRLPKSLIARVDKIAERMSKEGISTITRSDVHRFALEEGLNKIEAKAKKR